MACIPHLPNISQKAPPIPSTVTIVPVTDANKQAWAALCAKLWPHDTAEDMLSAWMSGAYDHEYLYILNNEAVAFISLSLRRDYVEGTGSSPVGYVEGIYVKPAHRRKGIAHALVAFAKAWARAEGCVEMASDCELINEDNRLFHRNVGFTEANRIVCFTMDLGIVN